MAGTAADLTLGIAPAVGSGGRSVLIYLDHNATAPLRGEVIEAMAAELRRTGNASSIHGAGRAARQALEEARDLIADAIGLPKGGTLVFTGGASEANNLALTGTGARRILASAIEHESVGSRATTALAVLASGVIDLDAVARELAECQGHSGGPADGAALLSVMVANNETGVIQPVAEIAEKARGAGVRLHSDAAQAVGRIPFDMAASGIDLVSLSAHKLGGPQGVGALAIAPGIEIAPMILGGGQERGMRAGTENVAGIVGFARAVDLARADRAAWEKVAHLRDRMEAGMRELHPEAVMFGTTSPRLPNTSCVALPGVKSETQIIALDLAGIAVSTGAACSSGKLRPSSVLRAMGVPEALAGSAIRISLCRDTDEAAIDHLLAIWGRLAMRQKGKHAA